MIITTANDIPNNEIIEILGIVKGQVVQSKHIGSDIAASFKTIVGGEQAFIEIMVLMIVKN